MAHRYGRALVIGGSVAGLLAARVLSDHFEEVTIVERDALARDAHPRKAVPQGRHAHVLLHRGIQIIDQLFPDLLPALLRAGLLMADMGQEFRWRHFGVWKTRFPSDIRILFVNRPLFEWQMAERLMASRNVRVIEHCDVTSLIVSQRGGRATGLQIRRASDSEQRQADDMLVADLIVDAGGRGSNPVYGQGMTVAALEAMALDRCLASQGQDLRGLGRRFHRTASKLVDIPWRLAVGEDLRYPKVKGDRPTGTGFLHWYIGLVHQATARDQHVTRRFYEVIHLMEPPPKLFHPGVLRRTAGCALRA